VKAVRRETHGAIPKDTSEHWRRPDFRALFEAAPGLYLVVTPDAPRYTVIAVSDAYLRATLRKRVEMLGRGLFDVWRRGPADPAATSVDAIAASLDRVVRNRAADAMTVQRHDVCHPEEMGAAPQVRFFRPSNSPVFGRDGELLYIIHRVEDVTEFVRLGQAQNDAVSTEQERFRELFESAPDGIFVAGPDGRYTDVNAAGCQLLGYSREELLGRSVAEFVAKDDLPRQAALKRRILEGGMDVSEWRLRRKDGTYVPVELSSNALPSGELRAFVRDITERRRAEDALRLSEAKFSGIVAISADAVICIDENQRITLFNEGAESIFGYSKGEVVGSPLDVLIPERFRANHREHVKKFAEGRETSRRMGARHVDIVGLRKNGEEFPTDAAISKLEVGGERVLTVFLRDISEQKRVEDAERLLAEIGKVLVTAGSDYQRLLADVAHVLVRGTADWCSVDIVQENDIHRLMIVHSDPAMAPVCKALERYPLRREQASPLRAVDGSVLMSDVPTAYLESLAQSDEHLRLLRSLDPGSFIIVPLVARGQAVGTLGLGAARTSRRFCQRDVALVERLASRMAMAVDNARLHEALERACRARDDVLGIVAHDLRNPLNTNVLHAHALRRARGEPERRDQKATDRIHCAAMHMSRLIQDLLDVSRIEGGQQLAVTKNTVATAGVLKEAVEQQQEAMLAADRTLKVDAEGAPASLWVDRSRLLQVLYNLLGNAIKFARRSITLGVRGGHSEVLWWVADDGAGVAAEDLPHLFDRFWQATRADRRGAGLGLSIVKGIVDAHGGRAWVDSELGQGTTVYFTLPVAPHS